MPLKKTTSKETNYANLLPEAGAYMLDELEGTVFKTEARIDSLVAPARETVLKRYPTLFTIITTVGVIATFLGLEQILLGFGLFSEHPALLFWVGIVILVLTGQLYKKL